MESRPLASPEAAAGSLKAEVADAGFQKPEDTPVLRMEDTRMNYGG